jgi:hypothetical protein
MIFVVAAILFASELFKDCGNCYEGYVKREENLPSIDHVRICYVCEICIRDFIG